MGPPYTSLTDINKFSVSSSNPSLIKAITGINANTPLSQKLRNNTFEILLNPLTPGTFLDLYINVNLPTLSRSQIIGKGTIYINPAEKLSNEEQENQISSEIFNNYLFYALYVAGFDVSTTCDNCKIDQSSPFILDDPYDDIVILSETGLSLNNTSSQIFNNIREWSFTYMLNYMQPEGIKVVSLPNPLLLQEYAVDQTNTPNTGSLTVREVSLCKLQKCTIF